METHRIVVQVLNGATGEIREIISWVKAPDEQSAVNKLMTKGRRDDYYYRFLGDRGVLNPTSGFDDTLIREEMTYFARF